MDSADLCYTPAVDLARMIRDRELSPVDVVDAVLARIEALEPRLNAFAALDADAARAAAREAGAALSGGGPIGPLHGVPVTIKDLTDAAGLPTRRGSHSTDPRPVAADAPLTERLRAAGAIVLGKTTASEFGWKGVSQSPLTGITHNPWRPGFNAGASSAGAGAAAAAGYGPLHQGSDGAGSIRMPSHFCGVFGMKPSFGRVPNWPVANNDQVSCAGPMTRSVADAALMLKIMAGPHPREFTTLEAPPADYPAGLRASLAGRRVAFSPDLGHARVDPQVAALADGAARVFEELGCIVETPATPFAADGPEVVRLLWAAHMRVHLPRLETHGDRMDPGLVACMRSADGLGLDDYVAARGRKLAIVDATHRFFEDWDLLVTPAVSVAAFPADRLTPEDWPPHEWDWLTWAEFSYPFNFSGNPAASAPCGFTADGLPVGLQIVGRRFDDLGVLQAAAAFESARPWSAARPPL